MAAVQKNQPQIFIETPYRNKQMLEAILHSCKSSTKLCIAADITLATESIRTLYVDQWKKQNPDIHKRPVIFIIG
jgi:16S rRNA (cytidine1402-2'-O)-methyltransferase